MSGVAAPPSYDEALQSKDMKSGQFHYSDNQPPQDAQYTSESGLAQNPQAPGHMEPSVQPDFVPADAVVIEEGGFRVRGSFNDMTVRRLFIRKVFLILGLQLLVTFGIVLVFYFVKDVKLFVQNSPGVYYAAYAVFVVFYIILVCSVKAARSHPHNLIMLSILTLVMSYMVGTITSFHDVESVVIGLGVTVVVCVAVILFSMQTKIDFTKCSGLLFILCFVLFMFCFMTIFTYWRSWYVHVVYGSLGALLFTLFLAFDTQLVMGGRKHELDPEEYIFGALVLYIDIIYIFLFLLGRR